jgi:hypothetical protein
MSDMLPAVRREADIQSVDTDSWIQVVGDVAKLAAHIAGTEFVPRGLRDNPAAVTAAIIYGREVGLPPMTALTHTHVIEGKPAMSAEAMRALVLAAGHELVVEETNGGRCVINARRRGSDKWTRVEWTIDQARAAGLAGKQVWKAYPRAMLQARATAEIVRLVFPDVIHGFRALEELDETDGPAEGSGPASSSSSTVQRKRRSSGGTKGEPTPASVERPALTGPPLPGEEGFELVVGGEPEGEAGEPPTTTELPEQQPPSAPEEETPGEEPPVVPESDDAPPPEVERPATKPDLRMVHASFHDVLQDISDDTEKRTERLAIASTIIGRFIDSFNELSQREARLIADTVARHKNRTDLWALLEATVDQP